MIGSINPFYAVYANNDGHKVGAKLLLDYLVTKKRDAYYAYVPPRFCLIEN